MLTVVSPVPRRPTSNEQVIAGSSLDIAPHNACASHPPWQLNSSIYVHQTLVVNALVCTVVEVTPLRAICVRLLLKGG
jgi:hypothetical protein